MGLDSFLALTGAQGEAMSCVRECMRKQAGRQVGRYVGRQKGKQADEQARRQAERQALGRHSVGAMPWRGLLGQMFGSLCRWQ